MEAIRTHHAQPVKFLTARAWCVPPRVYLLVSCRTFSATKQVGARKARTRQHQGTSPIGIGEND